MSVSHVSWIFNSLPCCVAHKMKINIIFLCFVLCFKTLPYAVFADVAIRGCLSRGLLGRKVCVGWGLKRGRGWVETEIKVRDISLLKNSDTRAVQSCRHLTWQGRGGWGRGELKDRKNVLSGKFRLINECKYKILTTQTQM